jgi:hypothetical protein
MPVEIKELVIRAVVDPRLHPRGESTRPAGEEGAGAEDREALVEASVREVLKILRRSKER